MFQRYFVAFLHEVYVAVKVIFASLENGIFYGMNNLVPIIVLFEQLLTGVFDHLLVWQVIWAVFIYNNEIILLPKMMSLRFLKWYDSICGW